MFGRNCSSLSCKQCAVELPGAPPTLVFSWDVSKLCRKGEMLAFGCSVLHLHPTGWNFMFSNKTCVILEMVETRVSLSAQDKDRCLSCFRLENSSIFLNNSCLKNAAIQLSCQCQKKTVSLNFLMSFQTFLTKDHYSVGCSVKYFLLILNSNRDCSALEIGSKWLEPESG